MLSEADRKTVEEWGHLRLPPGATNVQFHVEKGADAAIWLRLDVPCQERQALLQGAGFTQGLTSKRRAVRNYLRSDLPWWKPDAVEPFESGEYRQEQGARFASHIVLSSGDQGTCTAFLFVTHL